MGIPRNQHGQKTNIIFMKVWVMSDLLYQSAFSFSYVYLLPDNLVCSRCSYLLVAAFGAALFDFSSWSLNKITAVTRCLQEDHALCLPTGVGVYSAVMIRSHRKVRSEHLHKVTQRFQFSSVSSRWQRRQHKTTLFTVPMLQIRVGRSTMASHQAQCHCSALFSLRLSAPEQTTPPHHSSESSGVQSAPICECIWLDCKQSIAACEQPPLHLNSPAPLLSSLIFGWKLWAHCQAYGSSPFQFIKLYRGIENPP